MKLKITVLPGDGIGPEVRGEAVRILRCVADLGSYEFEFTERAIGGVAIDQFGTPLPAETIESCLESNAVLLGAVGSPKYDHLPPEKRVEAGLLGLRKALRRIRQSASCNRLSRHRRLFSAARPEIVRGADIMFVRELLGGLYFGEPRGFVGANREAAFNTMRYSVEEIERVAALLSNSPASAARKSPPSTRRTFSKLRSSGAQVVTLLGKEYPDVKLEHTYVDACAMRLITAPTQFRCGADRELVRRHSFRRSRRSSAVRSACWRLPPSAATSIFMSRYTVQRRTSPARASPIRSARLPRPRCCCATPRSSSRKPRHRAGHREGHRFRLSHAGSGARRQVRSQHHREMGKLVEQALAESWTAGVAYHAV